MAASLRQLAQRAILARELIRNAAPMRLLFLGACAVIAASLPCACLGAGAFRSPLGLRRARRRRLPAQRDLDFELPEGARAAIREGVPLTLRSRDRPASLSAATGSMRRVADARAALRAALPRPERALSGAQSQQRRAGVVPDARRRARCAARHQRSADSGSGAGRARSAATRSACAPASMCARCPMPCASSCSGPTIGASAASGTHGPRSSEAHARLDPGPDRLGTVGRCAADHGADGAAVGALQRSASLHRRRERRRSAGAADPDRRTADAADARLAQARGRLAARSAHGVDVGDARGRAAAAGVLFLGRVPQSRHRQLVPCRDPRRGSRMR